MLELKEVKINKNKNEPSILRGTDRRGKNRKKRRKQCNVLEEKKKKKKKKKNKKQETNQHQKREKKEKKKGIVSGLLIHVTSISLWYFKLGIIVKDLF